VKIHQIDPSLFSSIFGPASESCPFAISPACHCLYLGIDRIEPAATGHWPADPSSLHCWILPLAAGSNAKVEKVSSQNDDHIVKN